MTASHLTVLPLPLDDDRRELDALTARSVRLALWPEVDVADAATELVRVAHGSRGLLSAAIARVDRAVATEWSSVGARAADELRAARARLDRS